VTAPVDPRKPVTPRPSHARRVLKIWVVASVIGIVLTLIVVPIVNPTNGSSAQGFANLTNVVFTVIGVPIALFVWVFVAYSLIVFRERRAAGTAAEELQDGPPLQASARQQIAWLAVTGALAIFFVGWGMFGFYKQTTDPPAAALVVDVTGQQWTWTYDYPTFGVQSHVLELPLGRPVSFRVTSDDVLHGFVINGLGVAMDANPGTWVTAPTVTPKRLGTYAVRCVELCGLYHSFMWSQVDVVTPTDFTAWVKASRTRPGSVSS